MFILEMSTMNRARRNDAAQAIARVQTRALFRPEERRTRRDFFERRHELRDYFTHDQSLYVRSRRAVFSDEQRVHSVAARIVRGLHYHVIRERVPEGFEVIARHLLVLELDRDFPRDLIQRLIIDFGRCPGEVIGREEFVYRYIDFQAHPTDPQPGWMWCLGFYGSADFFVMVRPISDTGTPPLPYIARR